MIQKIAQALYDKKGINIICIDVRGVSAMTDYFIIATGTVERHVKALSDQVLKVVKEEGGNLYHIDGDQVADWIVMDFGDVFIHLFVPELREKYALEEIWKEGQIVDLDLSLERTS